MGTLPVCVDYLIQFNKRIVTMNIFYEWLASIGIDPRNLASRRQKNTKYFVWVSSAWLIQQLTTEVKEKGEKKNILNDGNRWTLLKKEKEIVNNNEKNNLVYVHFRTDELPGKRERRDARRRCHLKFRSIFHGYKSWKRNSQRMYTCFFVSRILYLLQVDWMYEFLNMLLKIVWIFLSGL